jgi:hypothetical protein
MKSDQDGVSQQAHLEQVERQTGRRPKDLDGPPFPLLLSDVWSAFFSISSSRQIGFSGPQPLTFSEIKAWQETTNNYLNGWEVETIKRLDLIYMRAING